MVANVIRRTAICGAVLLASCGGGDGDGASSADGDGTHTVKGTVRVAMSISDIPLTYLEAYNDAQDQSPEAARNVDCSPGFPDSGYDDLRTGAPITVTDEANKTIATTVLGEGTFDDDLACVFEFRVEVPPAKFYGLEIGGRSKVTSSFADLSADQWAWDLSVGDG